VKDGVLHRARETGPKACDRGAQRREWRRQCALLSRAVAGLDIAGAAVTMQPLITLFRSSRPIAAP